MFQSPTGVYVNHVDGPAQGGIGDMLPAGARSVGQGNDYLAATDVEASQTPTGFDDLNGDEDEESLPPAGFDDLYRPCSGSASRDEAE